ncbi:hypothetical protein ABK040_004003 [Willaertia magna]
MSCNLDTLFLFFNSIETNQLLAVSEMCSTVDNIVNQHCGDEWCALHIACSNTETSDATIEILLSHGANLNIRNEETPLLTAIRCNNYRALYTLLQHMSKLFESSFKFLNYLTEEQQSTTFELSCFQYFKKYSTTMPSMDFYLLIHKIYREQSFKNRLQFCNAVNNDVSFK